MTDKTQALLPVTQADRDEALALMHRVRGYAVGLPNDGHFAIQAFARHRISHSLPGDVGMREAALNLCDKPEWIKHRGGANPVSPHQLVEIKHRAGSTAIVAAGAVGWRHGAFIWEIMGTAPEADIVAYRLVNDYKLNKLLAALTPSALSGDAGEGVARKIARADHMMDQATEWLENQTERAEYWLSQAEGYRPDAQKWRDSLKRSRDRKEAKKHIAKPLAGATPPARDKRAKRGGGK